MKKILSLLAILFCFSGYSQTGTLYTPVTPESIKLTFNVNGVLRYDSIGDLIRNKVSFLKYFADSSTIRGLINSNTASFSNYLPLAGGTVTGNTLFSGSVAVGMSSYNNAFAVGNGANTYFNVTSPSGAYNSNYLQIRPGGASGLAMFGSTSAGWLLSAPNASGINIGTAGGSNSFTFTTNNTPASGSLTGPGAINTTGNIGTSASLLATTSLGLGNITAPVEMLHMSKTSATGAYLRIDGITGAPGIQTYGINGTFATPTATVAANIIGLWSMRGYGSNYTTGASAYIGGYASQNWTGTANGSYLMFGTTANNTTTAVSRMYIDQSGDIGIGTAGTAPANLTGATGVTNVQIHNSGTGTSNFSQLALSTAATASGAATGMVSFGSLGLSATDKRTASIYSYKTDASTVNGTGVLVFATGNGGTLADRWKIDNNGHLIAATDNSWDIGASAATRPRSGYFGTSVVAPFISVSSGTSAGVYLGAFGSLISLSDGVHQLRNSAGNNFTRLQFGGATSASPALAKNGTGIDFVFADASGFTAVQSLYDRFGAGSPEGVVTAPVSAHYHNTTGGTGTAFYVKESGTGNTGWVAK